MINQMIAELRMIESRTRRQWEDEAAERANSRDYNISPESKAALERGDRQRRTGVYQTEQWEYYSKGEFVEDLGKIQKLLGSALYEVETLYDRNYIRRMED